MDENIKYIASFEIKKVTAFTLDEFIEKVKTLIYKCGYGNF